jgi:hypothetical protein
MPWGRNCFPLATFSKASAGAAPDNYGNPRIKLVAPTSPLRFSSHLCYKEFTESSGVASRVILLQLSSPSGIKDFKRT